MEAQSIQTTVRQPHIALYQLQGYVHFGQYGIEGSFAIDITWVGLNTPSLE